MPRKLYPIEPEGSNLPPGGYEEPPVICGRCLNGIHCDCDDEWCSCECTLIEPGDPDFGEN
jgi:hypothetical protein